MMLRIAGELASGTILWMADERAIGEHVLPRLTAAAVSAGRPAPRVVAGVPVALCATDEVDAARDWANRALGHAEFSPNYQRLLEQGDATDVGDLLAAGDEAAVVARLGTFRDAGVTDLAVRVLPFGRDRDARIESRDRTDRVPRVVVPGALNRSSRTDARSAPPGVRHERGFGRRGPVGGAQKS